MTRRRLLCGLLLLSPLLAGLVGWLWIAIDRRLTRERFEQVKEGMTREEVIRTVGTPPGKHSLQFFEGCDYWATDDTAFFLKRPTFTEKIGDLLAPFGL
jgi:hypothetical protein